MDQLYIGSDHAGFILKERLKQSFKGIKDIGAESLDENDDYPDYAKKMGEKIANSGARGILVCGAGHGMNITANKIKGVRSTVCWSKRSAELAKMHTDVNVICIPGRLISENDAIEIINAWMSTEFSPEERHLRRIDKIKKIEVTK